MKKSKKVTFARFSASVLILVLCVTMYQGRHLFF